MLLVAHLDAKDALILFMRRVVFSLETELMRNQSLLIAEIDEDLMMMDATQNAYFNLNSVGKDIWNLLDTPKSYADLLTQLTQIYNIDRTQCQQDVEPFLEDMLKHQLVSVLT